MTLRYRDIQWDGLFPARPPEFNLGAFAPLHRNRNVLITGAGGSIGAALARAIFQLGPSALVLLDSSEQNLYYIDHELAALAGKTTIAPVLGSAADTSCVADIFARYRPQVVYHAAALKHVPLGEKNPFAVVQNNVFGTAALAKVARDHGAERLLMVSTDKSVNPESIMGASKRLAELLLCTVSTKRTRMTSIRLGNVLGSEGSVVPLFLKQIAKGGPVTVTDPNIERYFLTMGETVHRVLAAMAECPTEAAIAVPALNQPVKIADLARYLIAQSSQHNVEIKFTGLRPGDKLQEQFIADDEVILSETGSILKWVRGPSPLVLQLETGMVELDRAMQRRDVAKLLVVLMRLVPEYRPSSLLRGQLETGRR